MRIVDLVLSSRWELREKGITPDVVAMKGTAYQQLLDELERPNPTLFGMEIIIKPDSYFSDDTQAIVADSMAMFPPILEPRKEDL